jgi:hypothetical protein
MTIDWRSRRNDQLRHSALCQQIIQPLSFKSVLKTCFSIPETSVSANKE